MSLVVGLLLAVFSAVFNGSFVAFSKFESAALVHPFVFNLYLSFGVMCSSALIVPFMGALGSPPLVCSMGALAGLLFVGATSLSFISVSFVGLSTGQGVWGGTAILVAFLWGTLGPSPIGTPVVNLPLSLLACLLLLLGVIGIVKCQSIGKSTAERLGVNFATLTEPLALADEGSTRHLSPPSDGPSAATGSSSSSEGTSGGKAASASERLLGLLAALLVGVFGGSILVPMGFLPPSYHHWAVLAFLPSFGVGSVLGSGVLVAVWYMATSGQRHAAGESIHSPSVIGNPKTLLAGMASGAWWNIGNALQLISMSVYHVPYGVAYPILQAALVVAGLLGIFVFRELRERAAVAVFFLSSAVVILGAVLLGTFGPSAAPQAANATANATATAAADALF